MEHSGKWVLTSVWKVLHITHMWGFAVNRRCRSHTSLCKDAFWELCNLTWLSVKKVWEKLNLYLHGHLGRRKNYKRSIWKVTHMNMAFYLTKKTSCSQLLESYTLSNMNFNRLPANGRIFIIMTAPFTWHFILKYSIAKLILLRVRKYIWRRLSDFQWH